MQGENNEHHIFARTTPINSVDKCSLAYSNPIVKPMQVLFKVEVVIIAYSPGHFSVRSVTELEFVLFADIPVFRAPLAKRTTEA